MQTSRRLRITFFWWCNMQPFAMLPYARLKASISVPECCSRGGEPSQLLLVSSLSIFSSYSYLASYGSESHKAQLWQNAIKRSLGNLEILHITATCDDEFIWRPYKCNPCWMGWPFYRLYLSVWPVEFALASLKSFVTLFPAGLGICSVLTCTGIWMVVCFLLKPLLFYIIQP